MKYILSTGLVSLAFAFSLVLFQPVGNQGGLTGCAPVCYGQEVQGTCLGIAVNSPCDTIEEMLMRLLNIFLLFWGFLLVIKYVADYIQKKYKEISDKPLEKMYAIIASIIIYLLIVGLFFLI